MCSLRELCASRRNIRNALASRPDIGPGCREAEIQEKKAELVRDNVLSGIFNAFITKDSFFVSVVTVYIQIPRINIIPVR